MIVISYFLCVKSYTNLGKDLHGVYCSGDSKIGKPGKTAARYSGLVFNPCFIHTLNEEKGKYFETSFRASSMFYYMK